MKLFIALSLIYCFCLTSIYGQSQINEYNKKLLDSAKKELRKACEFYKSTKQPTNKQIKADKRVIKFFNNFYNNDLSLDSIKLKLNPFFNYKWDFETANLGGCIQYYTQIPSEGNLRAFISITTFDNEIVYKSLSFETNTKNTCLFNKDIDYIDKFVIPRASFPIEFCIYCMETISDTIYSEKFNRLKTSNYKILPEKSSNYLQRATWYRNSIYKMDYVEATIKYIVNNNEIDTLYKLLYSPNHILAINAMEALIFLESENKIVLTADVQHKMQEIKNSEILISWQYSDVVKHGTPYYQLKVSKQKIIVKFKRT